MKMTCAGVAAALIGALVECRAGLGPDAGSCGGGEEGRKAENVLEENKLFAYIENSFTVNLTGAGRGGVNEFRFYDNTEGYTFNAAEFSIKKDPSERYPFGYGWPSPPASTRRRITRTASSGG